MICLYLGGLKFSQRCWTNCILLCYYTIWIGI